MKSIYLKAKEIAATGDFDAAWEVARHDDTLDSGVTKEQWVAFVKRNLP